MWRSAVQLRAGLRYGGIAQLVEHLLCKQRVKSSNLFISTKKKHLQKCRCFFVFIPIRSHLLLLASGRDLLCNVLVAKTHTARKLRSDVLQTSSLRPFHRFLRPATQNLSPADTSPLYQERTSVRRPGRVFCGSKIWKGR